MQIGCSSIRLHDHGHSEHLTLFYALVLRKVSQKCSSASSVCTREGIVFRISLMLMTQIDLLFDAEIKVVLLKHHHRKEFALIDEN